MKTPPPQPTRESRARIRHRHRLITLFIPALVVLYVVMLPLNSALEKEHGELFPFFSWRLFSRVPDWQVTQYGLLVHSIAGIEVDRIPPGDSKYLIPSENIRHWKALIRVVRECNNRGTCDDTVAEVLYPIVFESLGATDIEFSIVKARVDLHNIQESIDDIAARAVNKTAFFQPESMIGQWNTNNGMDRTDE